MAKSESPQSGAENAGRQAKGDESIEERIQRDDAEAHQLYRISLMSGANAELDGRIADVFEDLGERKEAEQARDAQEHDLEESHSQKEKALALLLDEKVLKHIEAPPADPQRFVTNLPEIRQSVTALFTVVRKATQETDPERLPVARAYRQFIDLSNQPINGHDALVTLLRALQDFLEAVKPVASSDDAVREIWLVEAANIARNL